MPRGEEHNSILTTGGSSSLGKFIAKPALKVRLPASKIAGLSTLISTALAAGKRFQRDCHPLFSQ